MKRLYVVVRGDLPAGLQMAQACHAARAFARPWSLDENLIVLNAPDQPALWGLLLRATSDLDVDVAAFAEPDLGWQLTAIALCGAKVQKLLRDLPLAGAAADSPTLSVLTT